MAIFVTALCRCPLLVLVTYIFQDTDCLNNKCEEVHVAQARINCSYAISQNPTVNKDLSTLDSDMSLCIWIVVSCILFALIQKMVS